MRNKWIKRFFPLIVLLLLAPWPVAYAHSYDANALGKQDAVLIEIAEASAQPSWSTFGKAIGGVTPGDLFYIDVTDNLTDIVVTLYITNAQELINYYSYLILEVGIHAKSDAGEWEKASTGNGEPISETFVTLRNGYVKLTLPGLATYKVTIDGGSFYCTASNSDSGSLSPQYYLEVD